MAYLHVKSIDENRFQSVKGGNVRLRQDKTSFFFEKNSKAHCALPMSPVFIIFTLPRVPDRFTKVASFEEIPVTWKPGLKCY